MTEERQQASLPLWEHVAELSRRAKVWIYSFLVATILFLVIPADPASVTRNPFQIYQPLVARILRGMRDYLLPSQYTLIAGTVTVPLEVMFVAAALFGFVVSIPVLAYEIYKFVDPALEPSERQSTYPFVFTFSILFLGGGLFAFFVLLPFVFYFSLPFFSFVGISTFIYANDFYNLIFFVTIVTRLAFTIPVFFVLLVKLRIMETRPFVKNRKYVWAFTLILTAVASPDGGPLADVALFVPMIILIEGAIWYAKRFEKDRPARAFESSSLPVCSYCGGEIDATGVFCSRCGRSRT